MTRFIINLPDEIIFEILMMVSNSIPSMMNLGMSCSSFWELITQRGTLLWTSVLENMADQDPSRFKRKTISLLYVPMLPTDKCQKLLRVIRHQYRFELKKKIVSAAKQLEYQDKVLFVETVKFNDEITMKLVNSVIGSIKSYYSPENFVNKFGGSMGVLCDFLRQHQMANFTIGEVIDHFYKKKNAHKHLNPKVRDEISELYKEFTMKHVAQGIYSVLPLLGFAKNADDALLLLTFIYLECPIYETLNPNNTYFPMETFTGFELDQKKVLLGKPFLDIIQNHLTKVSLCSKKLDNITTIQQAISQFNDQVYGPTKVLHFEIL
ncbi:predicted protein [Naegleria gruberi]|uniref:Predicted protein n=1 Tax=Naegleria gruberi TaxID=5762 RepID=D2VHN6_NAEGR|nr:uncharacterized protein NAEGRDRAFT_68389 [Naegleria gruberi]EFC43621.1 predicted protein [Naegleria gruberi]|eukprot:XP_002676365.1 predicted protein [Naegleria gruberi strain NEG-M]